MNEAFINKTLSRCKRIVIKEILKLIPRKEPRATLYDLIAEYPSRAGKGLRPALCISTCCAYGGAREQALNSAVAFELFHNAFLIHDDVEDGSKRRRREPTLSEMVGVPIAVNVGDAMNVLAMRPLIRNLGILGPEKSYIIFWEVERMARESMEGQAIELGWVRNNTWDLSPNDYYVMTRKKTGWYTCIVPCRVGALIAGRSREEVKVFNGFGYNLGVGFQIQDDILNLVGEEDLYGKERAGDLWEGKRTLMLIHLLNTCSSRERKKLITILSKPREKKKIDEIAYILGLMNQHGSIEFARRTAATFAKRAKFILHRKLADMPSSIHKRFIAEIVDYMIYRRL